jgi:O-antigen ligase
MWRTRKNSLVGIAVSLSYPAVMVAAVIASFMFHAIRVKIWGGGAQAGSTEARVTQMHMGLPLIAKNPLGYGMGKAASVLNFRLPGGQLTIDNYYLSLALEFGVLGLAAFVAFIGLSMYLSAKHVLTSKLPSSDNRFYLAIFQSLLAFFVIKSVFSQQDNHPIIFMIVGLLLALLSQEPDIREAIARRRKAARK